ncbi:MAG TPA: autotransporter-associated beta strand repeat-containing protein [Gemmata sp.]|nr:autotransporter-associated beta strand repeat-containing protein [Gemmata sp.]
MHPVSKSFVLPSGFAHGSVWLAAVVLCVASPASVNAQSFTWNQATSGGNWQTAGNWLPSGTPNGVSNVAIFGNVATGANTVNLTAGVTLGELRFEDVNARSMTAAYTIASGQTITFDNNGSPALLTIAGMTRTNETVAATLSVAGGQPLNIANNGAPGLTTLAISGAMNATTANTALNIDGNANTTISGAINGNFGVLTKSGTGTLTLSGTNVYTGGTVITGGTVKITNDVQLGQTTGNPATSAAVTLDGGSLWFAGAVPVKRNFTLGSGGGTILTTTGNGATNPSITGVISGSGSFTADGGGYLNLGGVNTYSGATIINNAGLTLTGTGTLSSTSSITINGFVGGQIGLLSLDNTSGASNDRVNDAAAITLNGGLISNVSGVFANANEVFGDLTVRGFGTLYGNQIASFGGTASMTFGNVTRPDNFSTLYVGGPVGGAPVAGSNFQISFASAPTLSGSGTGQQIGIVPWIGGDAGDPANLTPTGFAETLYTYDANGLRALDPRASTNFAQIGAGNNIISGRNIALNGTPNAVNTNLTILSLITNPGDGTVNFSFLKGTGTLTISSGAIASAQPLVFDGPTLNFGTKTGYIYLGNEMSIDNGSFFGTVGTSSITGSAGLVVSSDATDDRNTLYLINTTNANTFTGGLYLNGTARVAFDTSDTQLGGAGEIISFLGGSLRYIGGGSVTLATGGVNRPLEMYAAGGGLINVENSGAVLIVPGLVSGTEQLTVIGPGTLVLSNTANTYAGGTTIGDSTLGIAGPGSLGTGNVTLGATIGATSYSGGTLRFDSSGTYAFNVNHTASSTLDTNGNDVTLSGVISGVGATLTKAGAGTLTFSGANTYTGNTAVNAGTLLVTNSTGMGTGYGSVTVATGAAFGGTSTVGGALTVNGTGKLIVGTPTGPGTLTLRGTTTMSNTSSFQVTLAGTTAGSGYSQLVITPGGSINLNNTTFLPTLSYAPDPSDKIVLINNQNASGGLSGTFNGLAQGATVTFANGTTALITYQGDAGTLNISGGNDVILYSFVPVPEPAATLGVAVAGLGLVMLRRRWRHATHSNETTLAV